MYVMVWSVHFFQDQIFILTCLDCSCSGFVNGKGYGKCKKSGWRFPEEKFCYVKMPSSCAGLVKSDTDKGRWASAQPCKNKEIPTVVVVEVVEFYQNKPKYSG